MDANGRFVSSRLYLDGCRLRRVCVLRGCGRGGVTSFYFEALGIFSAFFILKCGLHCLCKFWPTFILLTAI